MITSLARQSVMIKCNMNASVMLGNYEFYYAAGLFCRLRGISIEENCKPKELKERILPNLESFEGEDERERYLVKLLLAYAPSEEYDGQMQELLLWGLKEENLWKEN